MRLNLGAEGKIKSVYLSNNFLLIVLLGKKKKTHLNMTTPMKDLEIYLTKYGKSVG